MSKKLRRYLQVMSPLFAVQLFLVGLNVVLILNGATRVFWAIYPVLGMMIPQMIVGSFMFLREDDEERARQLMPQAVKVPKSGMKTAALPAQIDSTLVAEIERVRVYKGELERMARLSGNTLQAARLADLARQYEGWLGDVQQQAERITAFKLNAGMVPIPWTPK